MEARAAVTAGDGTFEIGMIGIDPPAAGEILVKIKASGVCHTDWDSLRWKKQLVLGHEGAGDVLARDGSGYLQCPHAEDVERWIVEEVPALARLAASALTRDAKIAIGGLSMGGYGALRLGAKYPDRFSSISAHSAISDVNEMESFVEEPLSDYLRDTPREELSVLYWLRKHRTHLPKLRFDCGIEDSLIETNRALHRVMEEKGIAHTYEEFAGGHEWPYWQKHVAKTLRFASDV